jgi:nitrile hydratase
MPSSALDTHRAAGERVRAGVADRAGHTRIPRYVRGHEGTIVAVNGTSLVPDRVVAGDPGEPEARYAVRFDSAELFGVPGHTVTIELFESYLD